jgi:hypothetical protein
MYSASEAVVMKLRIETSIDLHESDEMASPVFILSPARSYSTVSLALLSGHPRLFGFPETLLFLTPTIGELIEVCAHGPAMPRVEPTARSAALFRDSRLSGLARVIALLHEASQDEGAVLRALEWLFDHRQWSSVEVMDYLRQLISPQIAIEKTPEISYSNQALTRCISAYPNSRYLHLTRHPVTWQRSMDEASELWLRDAPPELSFRSACRSAGLMPAYNIMSWYTCHLRIIRALQAVPRDQWMRVRAEDLLSAPHVWLPRILSWLQLESSDLLIAQMIHTENWPFAGGRSDSRRRDGDWKFFADPALRPVELPESGLVDPKWQITPASYQRIAALATDLGY